MPTWRTSMLREERKYSNRRALSALLSATRTFWDAAKALTIGSFGSVAMARMKGSSERWLATAGLAEVGAVCALGGGAALEAVWAEAAMKMAAQTLSVREVSERSDGARIGNGEGREGWRLWSG